MSTLFQNRLVGTIIVAAVVIIFLPDVLDGEKQAHQTDFEAIPNAPVFSGKLTNKNFPEEALHQKSKEPIIAEKAQDYLIENSNSDSNTSDSKSKVTPAIKDELLGEVNDLDNTPSMKQIASINIPSINKVDVDSLPERAIPKQAWVIHLGSFKHKQNVAQLLAKLEANGYSTFTQPIKTKHGILTKVFVGPELIKSSLDKKLSELKKLTNTTGKVARFYPTK